ncbi:MAG TPA: bifunctional tetrahydrofolate synthase/dihydrofolate synthase [Methylotenera sp.]|nr:bifunctional tetrahydrofolate synthase/dihydrofolate synthase [Methylotenera sp.]HPH05012.1 bifunctional tetrahydrofolate synthase/dihydrofolate synthase [Methylotenera sp.]HPN00274.1 bifunctional tetrahydrofolate synthase/dihydrofolate synthase [Methylotenera sp.]
MPKDLPAWLSYIESLHPKAIAMGLERVKRMVERLNLQPTFSIITVAGTNGKGSTCAMLAQIYQQAGYQVGSYSSPHLLRYNERVKVNGVEASDADLCKAFAVVDGARNQDDVIALTYFEVGTLAAIWHFVQTKLDVVILEIGLGGRLDAVNAFEPDCAIVTSVDLDHQEFLGDTREEIGFEKAGVYRANTPAICGDAHPPASLVAHANHIKADFKCIKQDFDYQSAHGLWQFSMFGQVRYTLPQPALKGDYQLSNAACAISAVEALQLKLPVKEIAIAGAMQQVVLAGRFQTLNRPPEQHFQVILDVAHNPHAAIALAENLKAHRQSGAKTYAVFAMLADKDIHGVIAAVKNEIDVWYVANIDHVRGARAATLAKHIATLNPSAIIYQFDTITQAFAQACADIEACKDTHENDKIIAFGSFFTVSAVMQSAGVVKS